MSPAVTVAVVSWNTRDLLLRCLRSLEPEVAAGRASVWVVDNQSSDGSAEAARAEAPWATVIEAEENLGFGRAVNLVARESDSDWIAAANADVALEPGALEALLASGSDRRVAAVAPRLLLPGGEVQHSVYRFPTLPHTFLLELGLSRLVPGLGDRLLLLDFWNPEKAREVDWAIGAFVLFRRQAFDQVGGFDERQWMYAEDLDLGWSLHDAGWTTRYEPRARVLHEESAAAQVAFGEQKVAKSMAATYTVLVRRRGLARTWATAAVHVVGAGARYAWNALLTPIAPRRRWWKNLYWVWLWAHREGLRSRSTLLRGR
jgi:GT2 family glycosyltransferase